MQQTREHQPKDEFDIGIWPMTSNSEDKTEKCGVTQAMSVDLYTIINIYLITFTNPIN